MASLRSRLYLRIWLAVVAAVAALSLLMGWAWRLAREERSPPVRELVLRNEAGELIGKGRSDGPWRPGMPRQIEVITTDGQRLSVELSRPPHPAHPPGGPRAFGPWPPNFLWLMGLVALAVALGAYPIIRRLTKRLEQLQQGVERWGAGDLGARVPVEGSDEVAFLAERFNHAAERIEKLLSSHKTLLANASHELRSPLARIRMSLELMSERSDAQRHEISRSIQELDQLIDEILLASRLDTPEAAQEPQEAVDLTGLAAEECARVGAELSVEDSAALVLQASPRLLRRLLRNLLENAQRHGDGEVSLALARVGQEAQVRVNDRGPGIAPDQRLRIFEPFYRLPGASEREGGVGLGLALVKGIAELHGGRVSCEDRPGGGASFVVRLPLHGQSR